MAHILDPVAVLGYLNDMGYYNITPHQLKEFMKDLKKLIKYEEQEKREAQKLFVFQKSEQLYKTSTFSSKAKIAPKTKSCPSEIKVKVKNPVKVQKRRDQVIRPASQLNFAGKPEKGLKDLKISQSAPLPLKPKNTISQSSTKKGQSRKSSAASVCRKDTDPVALYHHYKKEWDKHKVPGENDHAELRWAIRQQMLIT